MRLRLVVCIAASALLAGCCGLPFSTDDIPDDAPSEGGSGARTVTLSVLDPDEPAEGVPLYIFWADPQIPQHLYLLGLRSDAGRVVAHVPPDVTLHVVAGGEPWTLEWLLDLIGPGPGPAEATVRVYPPRVDGTFDGAWSPAAVSVRNETGQGPVATVLHDVTPGASAESRVGFADRLQRVYANITWTNDVLTRADLGIGALHALEGDVNCQFQNRKDDLDSVGPLNESYDSGNHESSPCGQPPEDNGIFMGPATERPAVMPLGLEYAGNYSLRFGYPSDIEAACERMAGEYNLHYVDPSSGEVQRTVRAKGTYEAPASSAILLVLAGFVMLVAIARRRPS